MTGRGFGMESYSDALVNVSYLYVWPGVRGTIPFLTKAYDSSDAFLPGGKSFNISWAISYPYFTSCTASSSDPLWSGDVNPTEGTYSATTSILAHGTYVYDFSCNSPYGQATSTAIVNVGSDCSSEQASYSCANLPQYGCYCGDSFINAESLKIWQYPDPSLTRSYTGAVGYCNNLAISTESSYRLPTKDELINDNMSVSGLNFNNADYWTSSLYSTGIFYVVNGQTGSVGTSDQGTIFIPKLKNVRCVKNANTNWDTELL
jgi:hypothetical protein